MKLANTPKTTSDTLKMRLGKDTRRVRVVVPLRFVTLLELLRVSFKQHAETFVEGGGFSVQFQDDEGDLCSVTNDEELAEAFAVAKSASQVLTLVVTPRARSFTQEALEAPYSGPTDVLDDVLLGAPPAPPARAAPPAPPAVDHGTKSPSRADLDRNWRAKNQPEATGENQPEATMKSELPESKAPDHAAPTVVHGLRKLRTALEHAVPPQAAAAAAAAGAQLKNMLQQANEHAAAALASSSRQAERLISHASEAATLAEQEQRDLQEALRRSLEDAAAHAAAHAHAATTSTTVAPPSVATDSTVSDEAGEVAEKEDVEIAATAAEQQPQPQPQPAAEAPAPALTTASPPVVVQQVRTAVQQSATTLQSALDSVHAQLSSAEQRQQLLQQVNAAATQVADTVSSAEQRQCLVQRLNHVAAQSAATVRATYTQATTAEQRQQLSAGAQCAAHAVSSTAEQIHAGLTDPQQRQEMLRQVNAAAAQSVAAVQAAVDHAAPPEQREQVAQRARTLAAHAAQDAQRAISAILEQAQKEGARLQRSIERASQSEADHVYDSVLHRLCEDAEGKRRETLKVAKQKGKAMMRQQQQLLKQVAEQRAQVLRKEARRAKEDLLKVARKEAEQQRMTRLREARLTAEQMRRTVLDNAKHEAEALRASVVQSAQDEAARLRTAKQNAVAAAARTNTHAATEQEPEDELVAALLDDATSGDNGGSGDSVSAWTALPGKPGLWREVQLAEVLPAGSEVSMDMSTGRNYVKQIPPSIAAEAQPPCDADDEGAPFVVPASDVEIVLCAPPKGAGADSAGAPAVAAETDGFSVAFVGDKTLPDGSMVGAGMKLSKSWTVLNTGAVAWPHGAVMLVPVDGNMAAQGSKVLPTLAPGAEMDVTVELTAPQHGRGESAWVFQDASGRRLSDVMLWVEVDVAPAAKPVVKKPGARYNDHHHKLAALLETSQQPLEQCQEAETKTDPEAEAEGAVVSASTPDDSDNSNSSGAEGSSWTSLAMHALAGGVVGMVTHGLTGADTVATHADVDVSADETVEWTAAAAAQPQVEAQADADAAAAADSAETLEGAADGGDAGDAGDDNGDSNADGAEVDDAFVVVVPGEDNTTEVLEALEPAQNMEWTRHGPMVGVPPDYRFLTAVKVLHEMGFTDTGRSMQLLEQFDGNLPRVAAALLDPTAL